MTANEEAYLSGNPADTLHIVRKAHQLHLAGCYSANQLLPQHEPGLCSAVAKKVSSGSGSGSSSGSGKRAEALLAWKRKASTHKTAALGVQGKFIVGSQWRGVSTSMMSSWHALQ